MRVRSSTASRVAVGVLLASPLASGQDGEQKEPAARIEPVNNRYFWLPSYRRYDRPTRWNVFNVGEIGEYPIVDSRNFLDPYDTNLLKGDKPIAGENLFLRLDAVSATIVDRHDVAGDSIETDRKSDLFLSADLQYGDTVFRPPSWRGRVTLAHDLRRADVVTKDETENDDALQEAFAEALIREFDPHFDFLSVRAGRQAFASDFRKFVFADANDGVRLFGSWKANRYQYDLAGFDLVEKDKFSNLNRTTERRDQRIFTADLFVQDLWFKGYTQEATFLYVDDTKDNDVRIGYFGWNGQGHIGRFEVAHTLYEAVGKDDDNPIAKRSTNVNAQLAAVEVAYPVDWWKVVVSGLYASGDRDAADGNANGFDGVFDAPDFAGGGFGFWDRDAFNLAKKQLKNGNSLYPNLRTKNFQAPNGVNPGLLLLHTGLEATLSNQWSAFANALWMQFADTSSLEARFGKASVGKDLGVDVSLAAQYRPLAIDNIILTAGVSALFAGSGLKDLGSKDTLFGAFVTATFVF